LKVYVKSDKTISVDDRVVAFVEGEADHALGRYKRRLTRLDVHLSDENSHKAGGKDKRCVMEARPAGHSPLVVKTAAATVRSAVHDSLTKLESALEKSLARSGKGSEARKSTIRKAPLTLTAGQGAGNA
jgi:hypothetical protein